MIIKFHFTVLHRKTKYDFLKSNFVIHSFNSIHSSFYFLLLLRRNED